MINIKQLRIGTIGYSYKDWVGPFYPTGTPQRDYLTYYSRFFDTVELDTTFHAIPRRSIVENWVASTPKDFKFSLKTPRRITHELELRGANAEMDEFLESITPLGDKQGPILIQLPPRFTQDSTSILRDFIKNLPNAFRYAVEFRHKSWYNQSTIELLSGYNVCWTAIDYPRLPKEINLTTNFIYIRWIGINNLYHHHSFERIDRTERIKSWLDLIDLIGDKVDGIYGYINNDYAGFAAGTGIRFKHIAGFPNEGHEYPLQDRLL